MENKKTLKINCTVCDARNITEELLSSYDKVEINTASIITSPQAQTLFGKYKTRLNCASTTNLDENVNVSTINGPVTIAPNQMTPEGKIYLMVNGPLEILPGCEEVLKNYASMMINGPVTCPEK